MSSTISYNRFVDKEYLSELNRGFFTLDSCECVKNSTTNLVSVYITGSFIHYSREVLKHLLELHLGWYVKRTLHGCNICLMGSLISPEIYTRISAYDIKIYTELEAISLIKDHCKLINTGKFVKYLKFDTKLCNNVQLDYDKLVQYDSTKFDNTKCTGLWHKLFTPFKLWDIPGHQDELSEFYNFVKKWGLQKPVLVIHPPESSVYRAIELCLLTLNYELVSMDNSSSKSDFKRQKNSKFIQIPTYKVEKTTVAQLQSLYNLHKISIIFIKCRYDLVPVNVMGTNTKDVDNIDMNHISMDCHTNIHTVELQQPGWSGKVNFKRFVFYPPPYRAVAYRIQDILQDLDYYIEVKDIELLLGRCKVDGISSIESTLSKLMFILAGLPKSDENNSNTCVNWYIDNHLNYGLSDEIYENISEDSIDSTFDLIWERLYSIENDIIRVGKGLEMSIYFYNICNKLLTCEDEVSVYLTLYSCTTSLIV